MKLLLLSYIGSLVFPENLSPSPFRARLKTLRNEGEEVEGAGDEGADAEAEDEADWDRERFESFCLSVADTAGIVWWWKGGEVSGAAGHLLVRVESNSVRTFRASRSTSTVSVSLGFLRD